jgi:hypothetical protein
MIEKKEEKHWSGSYMQVVRIRGQLSEETDPGLANFNDEIQQVPVAAIQLI